jgi:hypothetical protein
LSAQPIGYLLARAAELREMATRAADGAVMASLIRVAERFETLAAERLVRCRTIPPAEMRHDGCGGRPGRVELLTGTEGVSSRPVRRIVLREG